MRRNKNLLNQRTAAVHEERKWLMLIASDVFMLEESAVLPPPPRPPRPPAI